MKNLTSIEEHSDWLEENILPGNIIQKWRLHRNRVEFGKQPLELYMFVPCKLVDGVWVVLEDPTMCDCLTEYDKECCGNFFTCEEYKRSKQNILFDNWTVRSIGLNVVRLKKGEISIVFFIDSISFYGSFFQKNEVSIIEDLVKYKPELTATAQKQIGL